MGQQQRRQSSVWGAKLTSQGADIKMTLALTAAEQQQNFPACQDNQPQISWLLARTVVKDWS